MTVNELLVVVKIVRERLNDLKLLRTEVANEKRFYGDAERVVEHKYEVVKVDKKITELQNFLMKADRAVAVTEVAFIVNAEQLLEPLS